MPPGRSTSRPRRLVVTGVGVGTAVVLGLTGCGGSSEATTTPAAATSGSTSAAASAVPTAPVLATAGDLRIAAGYVPAPASPDVAAAYLSIVDTGSSGDTLVGASSDVSTTTTMHRTEGGAMVMLDQVPVPAGGTTAFSPGADHLMLEGLTRTLAKGDTVTITLRFAQAGDVTVTVPVTGYPTGGGLPTEALSPLPSTTAAP